MSKESGIMNYGKKISKTIIHNSLLIIQKRAGQSLIEIMIALAIGAILIGTASLSIAFVLRSSTANQKLQSASGLVRDLVERIRSVSSARWQNIYGLTKGTSTAYFINASGTTLFILEGKEGVLGDDILSGLVGHWKFDEATSTANTTTYDASGNGNHGTLVGGTSRATSTCQVSHCLDFDGVNDAVQISDDDILDAVSNKQTISVWANTNVVNSQYHEILAKVAAGDIREYEIRLANSNKWQYVVYFSDETNCSVIGTTVPSVNVWYHITGVYDGAQTEVYVNGVSEGVVSCSKTMKTGTGIVYIGSTPTPYWNGRIDDVRIYNRALSADEINRLYGGTVFIRYLNLENVNRDSGGDIVTSGGNDDPSTQKITTYVEWTGVGSAVGQIKIVDYITRWSNRVFNQTDWSGGSGEEGPLTNPGSKYSSATSVSNPVGSIRIEGL